MKCATCGDYFRVDQWECNTECDKCLDAQSQPLYDPDDQVDVDTLLNPSGVTRAVFYD